MLYPNVINDFVGLTIEILGHQLTGIYLHGSLAMGCFNPEKSDIDLIVVIEHEITDIQKMQFMEQIVALNLRAPAKGLEISIVLRKYCAPFIYPTPFELHFSPAHLEWFYDNPQNYVENMKGIDKDLAAHFTIIRQYGVTLFGEEIEKVFAEVPAHNYIDSIWEDVENAKEDIMNQPVYIVLNLCRVLAFLQEGLCLSKREGGKWAMEHLPVEDTAIISSALKCYSTNQDMAIEEESGRTFSDKMLERIKVRMEHYVDKA